MYVNDFTDPDVPGRRPLSPARAALIFDVRAAVAALPPDLKSFAVVLMHARTEAEAARRTGRSRQRVRADRDRLARHLRPLDPRVRRAGD